MCVMAADWLSMCVMTADWLITCILNIDWCLGQEALLAEYEMREEAIQEMEAELDLLRQQRESQRFVTEEITSVTWDSLCLFHYLQERRGGFIIYTKYWVEISLF